MPNVSLTCNPYLQITDSGLDVEFIRADYGYIVYLTKGTQRIAKAVTPRTGRLTMGEVRSKCMDGRWGPTSTMHSVLVQFASIAKGATA